MIIPLFTERRLVALFQAALFGKFGPGLGPMKGKIWRVGFMGHNATPANVERFLDALGQCLG